MTSDDTKKTSFFSVDRNRLAVFFVLAAAIAGLVFSPVGPIFLGWSSMVSAQETSAPESNSGEPQVNQQEEQFMPPPTAAVVDMNASKVVVSGSAASPGDESGPFQILPILPERMDGKIYVGWIYFTATAPIYVVPGFGFDARNQTLNHDAFGELIRFPSEGSFANNTFAPPEIAHGPILPQYAPPVTSGIGQLPRVYSASVPFAGEVLEVGNVNGTKFLISYTVIADVYDTSRVSALEPAVMNVAGQGQEANHVSITPGAAEKSNDAFSPNPISVRIGENVTWTNDDMEPHTVTSGTPEQIATGEVGKLFDSGFIGTRSSFTHTFDTRGQFEYFCQIHPNMVGTVDVG
jgi:plastocyanin